MHATRTWIVAALFCLACGTDSVPVTMDTSSPEEIGGDGTDSAVTELPFDLFEAEDTGEVMGDIVLPETTDWVEETSSVGTFGWPCEDGSDCLSGYCIEGPDGKICTTGCQEECPAGYLCIQDAGSQPDILFLCVPAHARLCFPCQDDATCQAGGNDTGGRCVASAGNGSFCGGVCDESVACPDGYTCADVELLDGSAANQCVPSDGECTCSQSAIAAAATTECYTDNDIGTCFGERTCAAGGLTDCSAAVPAKETCNGLDDDCNGETDEGLGETTCGVGICEHTVANCKDGASATCDPLAGSVPEICNGQDDDCDGETDEEFTDTDNDGVADCMTDDDDGDGVVDGVDNCPQVPNEDQTNTDLDSQGDACDNDDDNDQIADEDDNCPLHANPGQEDDDGDDVGNPCDDDADGDGVEDDADNCLGLANPEQEDLDDDDIGDPCDDDMDGDGEFNLTDCAPTDPAVSHLATETCNDVDDDCDGTVDEENAEGCESWYMDVDQDGYGVAALEKCLCGPQELHTTQQAGDCKPLDDEMHPGLDEVCNGLDDNCNDIADEGFPDGDEDGIADCVDDDLDGDGIVDVVDNCPGLANPEQTDTDKDGKGDLCDDDDDGDGALDGDDCQPLDPAIFPGQIESCDSIDNDCDSEADEEWGFLWAACSLGEGECITWGQYVCLPDGSDIYCNAQPPEGVDELCDGLDNDCDGDVDENLGQTTCGLGPCEHAVPNCADGEAQVCDPFAGAANEACNGIDDDCDGDVDEDFVDTDTDGTPDCLDEDDDNDLDLDDVDCAPLDPSVGPSQDEVCFNDVNDDCNDETPDQCPLNSCAELKLADPDAPDGLYEIDPDGDGPMGLVEVYCDFSTDGGGWTGFDIGAASGSLGGELVIVIAGSNHGVDDQGRPWTQDHGGGHTAHYTFDVPFGYSEFYLKDYTAKANALSSYTTDLSKPNYFVMSDWSMGYAGGGWGDVGFGSPDEAGPVTSFSGEYVDTYGCNPCSDSGGYVSCTSCEFIYPANGKVHTVPAGSTGFRIGWGENGGQYEGWYPWWSGRIFVR